MMQFWVLLQLTLASIKMNRPEIAENAVRTAERRISKDKWPEYYDTKSARFIGKQSRLFQTWSIAGYLVSKLLLAQPNMAKILINEEDSELVNAFSCMITANPRRKRGRKGVKRSFIIWRSFLIEWWEPWRRTFHTNAYDWYNRKFLPGPGHG